MNQASRIRKSSIRNFLNGHTATEVSGGSCLTEHLHNLEKDLTHKISPSLEPVLHLRFIFLQPCF